MAATLVARSGDPQALKPLAAAAAAGVSLSVVPLADTAAWKKLVGEGSVPQGAQLLLVLPDGAVLTEPNAMARWAGEAGPQRGRGC